jgi:hypothetical protein
MVLSEAQLTAAPMTLGARPEPVSPFVLWSAEDLLPVEDIALAEEDRGLFVDLLQDPDALVKRMLDPTRIQSTLLGSLLVMVSSMSVFALAAGSGIGLDAPGLFRATTLLPLNTLLAVAAALGPAYATSILVAARMPMARLVTAMTSALAAGSVILAALSPLPYVLLELDPVWAGPLSLVGSFAAAAMLSGIRVRRTLMAMAVAVRRASLDDPAVELPDEVAHRVGILARMTMVVLAFTVSLSFWAFDALV